MALTMGVPAIASNISRHRHLLVAPRSGRARWSPRAGQQEVAQHHEGKRVVTKGQYSDAYSSVTDLDLWQRVQVAWTARSLTPALAAT